MSLLAKVFIIIQALLVMAYLGVTSTLYQHRRDWRLSYQKLQERHAAMTKRATRAMSTLRTDVTAKDDGIKQKDSEIQQLKKDLDRTLNDFQTKNQALSAMTSKFNRMQETNNNLAASNDKRNQDIAAIDQRIQELTENLRRAEDKRRLAEQQVARFMTQKYTLLGDIGDMRKDYVSARKHLRDKELLIAMAEERGVNFATLLDGPPVPLIKGSVGAVKADVEPALVLIDVGSNDKVEEGFRFAVYREDVFVGKLIVERVEADAAACSVQWVVEGGQVSVGDNVTTRLP